MTPATSGNVQYWRSVADKLQARRLARTGKEPAETTAVSREPNVQYWRSVVDKLRVRRLARTGKEPKATAAVCKEPVKKRWIMSPKGLHLQRHGENGWLRPQHSLLVPPCLQRAHARAIRAAPTPDERAASYAAAGRKPASTWFIVGDMSEY